MELTNDNFRLLVFMHAKNDYWIAPRDIDPAMFEPSVRKLARLGLLETKASPASFETTKFTIYITTKGREYVLSQDPVEVTWLFIDMAFWNYAVYWIERFVPVERLPEFFVHTNDDVRRAASEKLTGNCSDLVFPLETYERSYNRARNI